LALVFNPRFETIFQKAVDATVSDV
jgi:hypothetical protein